MAKDKKKFTIKEFMPTKGELDYKTATYNQTYFKLPEYPIIDGKPFIWTEQDHLDVLAAFKGKKIEEARNNKPLVKDFIDDGMNEVDNYIEYCRRNRKD